MRNKPQSLHANQNKISACGVLLPQRNTLLCGDTIAASSFCAGGQLAWHVAARYGHIDIIKVLVTALTYLPNGPDQIKGFLRFGHSTDQIVANILSEQDSKGLTPLHMACIYNHGDVAGYLVDLGANPFIVVSVAWPAVAGLGQAPHSGYCWMPALLMFCQCTR